MNDPATEQATETGPTPAVTVAQLLETVTRELAGPAVAEATSAQAAALLGMPGAELPTPTERGEKFVLFSLGSTDCALALAGVLEIQRLPPVTPLPLVPAWLLGIANLRGEILSVVDLGRFLGLTEGLTSPRRRLIVVQPADGSFSLGLVVDQVESIRAVEAHQVQPLSAELHRLDALFVSGTLELEAKFRAVLDLERLLQSSRLNQLEPSG